MPPTQRLGLAARATTPRSGPAPVRVLCAVSPDERRLFLRRARATLECHPVTIEWALERDARPRHLQRFSPDIVVTAWSTGPLPSAWLESPDCSLRYVCHIMGSVRHLIPRTFIERGGLVTNWGDIPASAVAEQALLLALAALRNLPAWPAAEAQLCDTATRIENLDTRSLAGRRVGIHGFGRVARALLPLLRPFGVSLRIYSSGVPPRLFADAGVVPCPSLEALFAGSEILFECEGLTPATHGSVSARILAALPDGAVFVNVGRGQIVDETALLREVSNRRLRAALDVVATEPRQRMRARLRAAGAVLSPHIGGPTLDQYRRCGDFALGNIARYVRGDPLLGLVTPADYDRST